VRSRDLVKNLVAQSIQLANVIALPILLVVAMFSNYIIVLLYGDGYSAASRSVYPLVLACLFYLSTSIINAMLIGLGKTWVALGLNSGWTLSFVVSIYVLVPSLGLVGLSYAFTISYGLLAVVSFYVADQFLGLNFKCTYSIVAASCSVLGSGFILVEAGSLANPLSRVMVCLVGTAVIGYVGRTTLMPILQGMARTLLSLLRS
jgi:O-antigen/teichoic acid export membrane protein